MPLQEYLAPNRAVLAVNDIAINRVAMTPGTASDIVDNTDMQLQVYYYTLEIPLGAIRRLELSGSGFLPTLRISFEDRSNIMSDEGLPVDDTVLTVRIPAKSDLLAPVHMDFKIISYDYTEDVGARVFNMDCVCSVDKVLVAPFKAYGRQTSWEVLKAVAMDAGLGYRSNVSTTQDRMTWLNPGMTPLTFVEDEVVPHAWNGESGFMWSFIDHYYNLCYVDVEKALQEDAKKNLAVLQTDVLRGTDKGNEVTAPLVLTTDPSGKYSNTWVTDVAVRNASTATSLRNGYTKDVHFYDVAGNWSKKAGSFMQFTVDSITTPGAERKSVILKGRPGDQKFVKANTSRAWAGRLDTDNAHKDYAYATVQNEQNLADLSKVTMTLTLPQPNMNIYRFMKVQVMLSYMHKPAVGQSPVSERLSGQWLVTGVDYVYTRGGRQAAAGTLTQRVHLVKRELNVADFSL